MLSRRVVRRVACLLALGFFLLSPCSWASGFDSEFDEKPWSEVEVQLPPFPEAGDLIPFRVGASTDTKYAIDSKSISYGDDGVIRYVLEVVSAAGARNVSFEGMRCETGERRFYAFGRADKTWSKARGNQWVKISGTSNNHHVELFSNYFCPLGSLSVRSAEEARRSLLNGGQRAERN